MLNVDELAHLAWARGSQSYLDTAWEWQNEDGGFGLTESYASDVYDTMLVLLAQEAVWEKDGLEEITDSTEQKYHSDRMTKAVNYLIGQQKADGGFGYTKFDISVPELSAQVGIVLLLASVDNASVYEKLDSYCQNVFTADFSEDIRKLNENHEKIKENIRNISKQIKNIEAKFISSATLFSKREKVNYAKAKIDVFVEMNDAGIFESVDEEIEELKEKILRLEEKIKGFDVGKKMSKAEIFLDDNMNRLSSTLDFEEEYKPIDLHFGLTDGSFDIYQRQNNNENIHLYEMGSGANWVSCHIALFLSFLHYFSILFYMLYSYVLVIFVKI